MRRRAINIKMAALTYGTRAFCAIERLAAVLTIDDFGRRARCSRAKMRTRLRRLETIFVAFAALKSSKAAESWKTRAAAGLHKRFAVATLTIVAEADRRLGAFDA